MTTLTKGLNQRYLAVQAKLSESVAAAGRSVGSVQLLPVSKTFGIKAIEEAIACGMECFGENYVQEACEKIDYFRSVRPDLQLTWHFIGHLQSNKTRAVAERFDWVQTVDRLKIAQRLNDQRPQDMAPLNVLIEVHISGEESKSGADPKDLPALASEIIKLPHLRLRGLMAIPELVETEEGKMKPLLEMRKLFDDLVSKGFKLDTLSMGMSQDMVEAVKAGSTMVRVGTAIFGPRDYGENNHEKQ